MQTLTRNLGCGILLCFALKTLSAGGPETVERGRYLVEEVGKCQDCHSPRAESGAFDKTKWLKGSVLGFQPLQPIASWRKAAPDLTSTGRLFQRWKEEGLVKFLTIGQGPSGNAADPPMPAYKLKQADAEAIVEYLKTLK